MFVLRLSNGMFIGACSNSDELWNRGYALMDKGCMELQRRASRFTGPEIRTEERCVQLKSGTDVGASRKSAGELSLYPVGPLIGATA